MCSSVYKVVSEKLDNSWIKIYFSQDKGEKTIIERGEELGNIKSKGTSRQIFDPPYTNEVSQHYACISYRLRLEFSKLALMDKVVG